MAKKIQLFTVRNQQGQFLAKYYAFTAPQAINKLIQDMAATAATFRKSQPMSLRAEGLTATVE